jgi:hypothetical protein
VGEKQILEPKHWVNYSMRTTIYYDKPWNSATVHQINKTKQAKKKIKQNKTKQGLIETG